MNKRQSIIIACGIFVIICICIYCLTMYREIDKRYPKGTYKFQTTQKTMRIRELYWTLGLYTIAAGVSTVALAYAARTKTDIRKQNYTHKGTIENIKEDIDKFNKEKHSSDDLEAQMRHIGELKYKGLISESEYNEMVDQIFEKI